MPKSQFYWLISVPRQGSPFDRLVSKLGKEEKLYRMKVPDLRVGTLDALITLSDDLVKADVFVEATVRKIAAQLCTLFQDSQSGAQAQSQNQILSVGGASPEVYLTHFEWDEAKFPVRSPLNELADLIKSQVAKMDEEFRTKANEYNALAQIIAAAQRKQGGNLMARDLSDLIKPEHITESENMSTLVVVVPKYLAKEFEDAYETMTEFVVPRSAQKVFEDSENSLYTVVLFKRVVEDFKNAARDKRYTVRDFKLDSTSLKNDVEAKKKMASDRDEQKSKLILWCKTNFAEVFIHWIHLKAVRVFVESILRYGLPANFEPMLILPPRKDDKKTRDVLDSEFKHLGSVLMQGTDAFDDTNVAAAAGAGAGEKFYPYVYLSVNLEFESS